MILQGNILSLGKNTLVYTLSILHPLKHKVQHFHFFNLFFIPPYHQIYPAPLDNEKSCFFRLRRHIAGCPKDMENSQHCISAIGRFCCAWKSTAAAHGDCQACRRRWMCWFWTCQQWLVENGNGVVGQFKILTLLQSLVRDVYCY